MLRPYQRLYLAACYAPPGDPDDLLDELVVGKPRDPRRLRETGVHRRVGNDAGERIQLDDVGDTEPIHANVDAAPVATAEGAIRVERDALRLAAQRVGDAARRAPEDRERMLARIPDPFRFVAVHRRRARRQRREIESDDRQAAHVAVITEDRDRELRSGEIGLDDDRLAVALQEERHALGELRGGLA